MTRFWLCPGDAGGYDQYDTRESRLNDRGRWEYLERYDVYHQDQWREGRFQEQSFATEAEVIAAVILVHERFIIGTHEEIKQLQERLRQLQGEP